MASTLRLAVGFPSLTAYLVELTSTADPEPDQ